MSVLTRSRERQLRKEARKRIAAAKQAEATQAKASDDNVIPLRQRVTTTARRAKVAGLAALPAKAVKALVVAKAAKGAHAPKQRRTLRRPRGHGRAAAMAGLLTLYDLAVGQVSSIVATFGGYFLWAKAAGAHWRGAHARTFVFGGAGMTLFAAEMGMLVGVVDAVSMFLFGGFAVTAALFAFDLTVWVVAMLVAAVLRAKSRGLRADITRMAATVRA